MCVCFFLCVCENQSQFPYLSALFEHTKRKCDKTEQYMDRPACDYRMIIDQWLLCNIFCVIYNLIIACKKETHLIDRQRQLLLDTKLTIEHTRFIAIRTHSFVTVYVHDSELLNLFNWFDDIIVRFESIDSI